MAQPISVEKVAAGFRIDATIYEEVKLIADQQHRSLAAVFVILITEQLKRYRVGGFEAVYANIPPIPANPITQPAPAQSNPPV